MVTFNAINLAHVGIVVIDIAAVGLSGELLVSASMALKAVIHLYLIIRCGFTVTSFARNLFGSVPIGQILSRKQKRNKKFRIKRLKSK